MRELEDILRLKERMAEDQERQLAGAFETAEQLRSELAESRRVSALRRCAASSLGLTYHAPVPQQLAAFREEQEAFPLSDMDLLHRYQRQTALFELIQESLTCPICYSAFAKDAEGRPVSLQCGHSFCETCFGTWEGERAVCWALAASTDATIFSFVQPSTSTPSRTRINKGRMAAPSAPNVGAPMCAKVACASGVRFTYLSSSGYRC